MPKDRKNLQGFEARHGSAHNNNNGLFISSAAGAAAGGGIIATLVAILLRQNNHHHGTLKEQLKDVVTAWENADAEAQIEAAASLEALGALLADKNTNLTEFIENHYAQNNQKERLHLREVEILSRKIKTLKHQYSEAKAVSEWAERTHKISFDIYKESKEFTSDYERISEKDAIEGRGVRKEKTEIKREDGVNDDDNN